MRISTPELVNLSGYETGKIKFFNYDKGYGFVSFENDVELFTCHQWLSEPYVKIENNQFSIGFRKTDLRFVQEQIVSFKPIDNKGKLEAHDVCDSLRLSFVGIELKNDFEKAIELYNILPTYHVQLIHEIVVPKANNVKKDFDWIKVDERVVELFHGNDLNLLKDTLSKEHIRAAINKDHTKLEFAIHIDGNWVTCDNPLLKVAG